MNSSRTRSFLPLAAALTVTLAACCLTGCAATEGQETVALPTARVTPSDSTPSPTASDTASPTPTPSPSVTAKANGIERRTGSQAVTSTLQANRINPVRVTGSYTTKELTLEAPEAKAKTTEDQTISIAVTGAPSAFSAKLSAGKQKARIIRVNKEVYIKGNNSLAKSLGIAAVQKNWVKFSVSDTRITKWLRFANVWDLLDTVLKNPGKGVTHEVKAAGVSTASEPTARIDIIDNRNSSGWVLVASTGKPLPIQLKIADHTGSLSLQFTNRDKAKKAEAPDASTVSNAPAL